MNNLENPTLINEVVEGLVVYNEAKMDSLEKKINQLEDDKKILEIENAQLIDNLINSKSDYIYKIKKSELTFLVLRRLLRSIKRRLVYPIRILDIWYLRSSNQFDSDWYLLNYPDVRASNIDPIFHYVFYGAFEGRSPIDISKLDLKIELTSQGVFNRNPYVRALKSNRVIAIDAGLNYEKDEECLLENAAPITFSDDVNTGLWYGLNEMPKSKLFDPNSSSQKEAAVYEAQTINIANQFIFTDVNSDGIKFLRSLLDSNFFIDVTKYKDHNKHCPSSKSKPSFTLITSYFKHFEYFKECISSVSVMFDHFKDADRFEWIILNDDPARSFTDLYELIPDGLHRVTRIISDGKNRGIVKRLNEGVESSKYQWILFLDCDDLINSNSLNVLTHYIREFPHARYISSCSIDIDEKGKELRQNLRFKGPDGLFSQGMILGHLKAIRKDLLNDYEGFDPRFEGCQDYDLALRVVKSEPVLMIPDHLYRYRWHKNTQSISNDELQLYTTKLILLNLIIGSVDFSKKLEFELDLEKKENVKGVCFIRTQGVRNDLLQETVESVLNQKVPITPCIILHGDHTSFMQLCEWKKRFGDKVELVHAPNTNLERGYPFNVGLDYIEKTPTRYDFFCILDDDDIYYRIFSERMVDELYSSGSDVVYCLANARVPGEQVFYQHDAMPSSCLVYLNFIPTNAFIVKTKFYFENKVMFRDDLRYLEDWDFLQSLLIAGAKFSFISEALSEYRIIGDGSTVLKNDPVRFECARRLVSARGALIAKWLGMNYFYKDLVEFGVGRIIDLPKNKRDEVLKTFELFKLMSNSKNLLIP